MNSSLLKEALRSYSASIEDRKKGIFLIKKNPELKPKACCFDTLIEAKKVAPKVFTLKTLIYFKDHNGWIIEELKSFIERELPKNSPAFKATLRQILLF